MTGAVEGASDGLGDRIIITPFEIFFNELQILDVNFLDVDVGGTTQTIRTAIAQWYYIMRLIASIILLAILIFTGIKMAISSIAEEKAMYKKTLVDWATSLALIFLLHYIIMFVVNVNSALVNALKEVAKSSEMGNVNDAILDIALTSLGISFESMAATVVYCLFVFQTIAFLFQYMKRMLTIGFLIIISPLITITYTIDRMGDGKAQALNNWLKEFIFGILIQPFHCILYMAFLNTAFRLLTGEDGGVDVTNLLPFTLDSQLANCILAIMCMGFISSGEKIVKKIFGFDQASSLSPVQTAAAATMVMKSGQMAAGAAKGARKGINMAKEKGLFASVRKDLAKSNRQAKSLEKKASKLLKKDSSLSTIEDAKKAIETQQATKAQKGVRGMANRMRSTREDKKNAKLLDQLIKNNPDIQSLKDAQGKKSEDVKKALDEFKGQNPEAFAKGQQDVKDRSISGRIGKAANSETGRWIRDFGKKSIVGGFAAFTGIAAYATTEDSGMGIFSGISAGQGMYKGINEFLNTSTKNLAKDGSKYVDGRFSNEEELKEHNQKVYQRGQSGDYEKNSEHMKDILRQLETALKDMKQGDKFQSIKAQIAHQATANPLGMNLDSILRDAIGDSYTENAKLTNAAQGYADFTKDKNLYASMNSGAELGMGIDTFTKALDKYVSYSERSATDSEPQESSQEPEVVLVDHRNVIEEIKRTEDIQDVINRVDDGDVERVKSMLQQEYDKLEERFNSLASQQQTLGYNEKRNTQMNDINEYQMKIHEVIQNLDSNN